MPDLAAVERLYETSLQQHGVTPKGVGWRDEDSHELRFAKQVELISTGKEFTVNDLGCGYGAFHTYLVTHRLPVSHFRGYDVSRGMLAEARRRLPAEGTELMLGSQLDRSADYSFASGIFNVRLQETEEAWTAHILETLDNMRAFSAKGFAFNLLTSYVDWREDHLYYGDPLFFFDHCKRHLSRNVALLHDYPLWEWTILVRL